jgi:hypothetical protein
VTAVTPHVEETGVCGVRLTMAGPSFDHHVVQIGAQTDAGMKKTVVETKGKVFLCLACLWKERQETAEGVFPAQRSWRTEGRSALCRPANFTT